MAPVKNFGTTFLFDFYTHQRWPILNRFDTMHICHRETDTVTISIGEMPRAVSPNKIRPLFRQTNTVITAKLIRPLNQTKYYDQCYPFGESEKAANIFMCAAFGQPVSHLPNDKQHDPNGFVQPEMRLYFSFDNWCSY